MSKQLIHKLHNRAHRKARIRSVVSGTAERPRLRVSVSNLHVTAQLIDDTAGKTVAYVTTVGQKSLKGTMTEKAAWAGAEIAASAKTKKIKAVVFDRGGKLYHGRVAALADAARKAGLEF
jgi:large subunit ribosomal protein L18